ncbi:MAG: hypothetical protein U0529_05720 [Thermoanaerobaculia bacterium]
MPGARRAQTISLCGAREHNLAGFDLEIPRGKLTVVTGVSGSGKSSLAFDTLLREGQRRFLELVPSYARQFAGGFRRPEIVSVEGLGPAVAVSQGIALSNPRSTVGTMTEVWDLLRLLYARLGEAPEGVTLSRGLFGFNGEGACPSCRGLGVEDRLDPELLVADASRTIREGALRVSTPNGYLMYSQVTLAVLDDVLRAHGGSVDVPWRDLSDEVRGVVLNGSDRLLVPFGKHPLENRLKWKGITARPREEGHYRGLLPVMEEILRGKRNDSILRFVRTSPCRDCGGSRLRPEARSVLWRGRPIDALAAFSARELRRFLAADGDGGPVFAPIRDEVLARCALMDDLGLGDLAFDRAAPTLSTAEARRLRLLSLALGDLRGLLVVLDEPSAGLHPRDIARLLRVLRGLRDRGQTVVVVDHDPALARSADWLVDLGPGPGSAGGRLLFSGPPDDLLAPDGPDTPTRRWLLEEAAATLSPGASRGTSPRATAASSSGLALVALAGLTRHNVAGVTLRLLPHALNLVTGVAGAGKSSLLAAAVERLRADAAFPRVVVIDADPIGRTPRSNPATYTGAFDLVRDLFAATPAAKARGFGKGHFSFNTAGGRCESCEGAGVHEVGMRYLGSVDLVCDACAGRRFHPDVLEVRLDGLSIADVLERSVADAAARFRGHQRLARILDALLGLGLGYLPLGQPATTLSGGEAQRVKLATELAKASSPALVVLDEPTTGLHAADVAVLVAAFGRLCEAGHTLLVADHDLGLVRAADRVTELGPGSGPDGGRVVVEGSLEDLVACAEAPTGAALRGEVVVAAEPSAAARTAGAENGDDAVLELSGVTTHNLRGVTAAFPVPGFTVVTGPSGSGKSSLVFDTLLAESQARFADLVSPWARRFLPMKGGAELEAASGLTAAVAVPAEAGRRNPRATVGTVTEIDERLRLLFARAGSRPCPRCGRDASGPACACGERLAPLWAADFSPHAERGACPSCRGLGFLEACDPSRLVSRPDLPLDGGALDGTRFGAYLGEADGQHMATLRAAAGALGLDVSGPWRGLSPEARSLAMDGAGERVFDVPWEYRRGKRTGVHRFSSPWKGLARLVEAEYERVHADERGEELEPLLVDRPCAACGGERLRPAARAVVFAGLRAPEAAALDADGLAAWLDGPAGADAGTGLEHVAGPIRSDLRRRVEALRDSGLGYLSPSREIATLSGGEAQRVRLAAALGGGLVGVTYVLDEPTQGLHPRDTARLAAVLRGLAEAGNAVVVVEHDAALVAAADHVVELGPGSGPDGGLVVASGSPADLRSDASTYTGRLLRRAVPRRSSAPRALSPGVTVRGAYWHNLKDVDVSFPAGGLVVVAGVSGSGKSTLVLDVLAPSLRASFRGEEPVGCRALELHSPLADLLASGQDFLAVGGASTVATLAGVADGLRRRFAATPEAKARKLSARAFSAAVPGGRCEACAGRGVVTVAMDLLPDVTVGCEVCGGRRYSDDVLACRVDGRSLTDLLDAPVAEVASWLSADRSTAAPLLDLREIGLGYLRLGQEGVALSSGERQRLRLARLLAAASARPTAVLLDEPTRGLGFDDVDRLLAALERLAAAGHLVVVVEHHPEVIAAADWLVELGPEGGERGGRVVRAGGR